MEILGKGIAVRGIIAAAVHWHRCGSSEMGYVQQKDSTEKSLAHKKAPAV
jgi:hypothetical protein